MKNAKKNQSPAPKFRSGVAVAAQRMSGAGRHKQQVDIESIDDVIESWSGDSEGDDGRFVSFYDQ